MTFFVETMRMWWISCFGLFLSVAARRDDYRIGKTCNLVLFVITISIRVNYLELYMIKKYD